MSDDDFNIDEFVADPAKAESMSGGNLRKILEKALREKAEADARIAALEADAASRQVTDTWEKLGVPEAIRKTYRGTQSAEEITSWWEESKGFYNLDAVNNTATETREQADAQQALSAVQQAGALGSSANTGYEAALSKATEIQTKIASGAASKADLAEFFKLAGIPRG